MYAKALLKNCGTLREVPKKFFRRGYHSDAVFGYKNRPRKRFVLPENVQRTRNDNSNFYRLVTAYRQHAHKVADINPVALTRTITVEPELHPSRYGLKETDIVEFENILNCDQKSGTVAEAVDFLKTVYCKTLSAEFSYLESEEETEWFSEQMEKWQSVTLDDSTKIRIATEMLKSQAFDNFLATKFTGVKRYGGEGAESMMAFFSEFFRLASQENIEHIVMCMPHRGRLNLLTGMLNYPPVAMFSKLKGLPDFPPHYHATGDVLSHCISSTDLQYDEKSVHISLLYNPSHLEAVNPVSMGKTRAKQLENQDGDYSETHKWSDKILNLQVHGDAAFTGQGVNQECLGFCGVAHFEIGGSVHLIVNNQLGFTTPSDKGRSSRYCTDLAKYVSAPVLHVNGDFPEAVVKATHIAFEYQRKFRKEVFVDLNCYRQWGHNEMDDPTFTNPALYSIIRSRGTVPNLYAEKLIGDGVMTEETKGVIVKNHMSWLNDHLKATDSYEVEDKHFKKQWEGYGQAQNVITTWDTGVNLGVLTFIGTKSVTYPASFTVHPHLLKTHVKTRLSKIAEGINIDWSTAESLAFGSLLYEGYNVRISGQDVGRGTFSHRHIMLVDQSTNNLYIPLNNIHSKQNAFLEIANSILSEEAVLGYEYGMSIESPRNLIIWEAQFGDFFNGAQIIFDTFVSSGESKWLRSSGLVVMLPHGYDGAGPEHSSSRVERFLQMTDSREEQIDSDNVNMEVCQPSTPAQYFHLLRRQMLRNYKKPLVVVAPKTLLRLSAATSNFSDMAPGTTFRPVIGDPMYDTSRVRKVLITSGKHYYNLLEKRQALGVRDTAIVRLESFCPFPVFALKQELEKYGDVKEFIWCQEEPRNMGAWSFIKPRFENLLARKIQYCGRDTLPAPAVGVAKWHQQQAEDVVNKPFVERHEK